MVANLNTLIDTNRGSSIQVNILTQIGLLNYFYHLRSWPVSDYFLSFLGYKGNILGFNVHRNISYINGKFLPEDKNYLLNRILF